MKRIALVLAALALAVPLRSQTVDALEFTLKNGLTAVLVEDHRVPSVCFAVGFRVGSRNERPGITGISHLFEHMMFNGSKKYPPKEFDRILESGGGYSNAYTSNDITFYYEEFNPDLLDKVLDMEADRMRALKIDAENLEQERGIVKEERRVGVDNDVQGAMIEHLYAGAFLAHPYGHPVIGWMKDIDNITVEDARAYFRTFYAPNNAAIFLVGDFSARAVRPKIEKLFGSIPRGPAPPRVIDAEPDQEGERRIALHKPAELPAVAMAFRGAPAAHADFPALSLLAGILSTGQSSRLYRRLVYELELATAAGAGIDEFADAGLFTVFIQMQPEEETADAEKEVYRILRDIAENGVTAEELQKAKNAAQVDYVGNFTTQVGIAGRLGFYELVHGDYRKSFEVPAAHERVTADDIRRVAAQYLQERRRTIVTLFPESSAGAD